MSIFWNYSLDIYHFKMLIAINQLIYFLVNIVLHGNGP